MKHAEGCGRMNMSMYQEQYSVVANDFVHAGKAATKIKATLKQLGIPPTILRNVAIACYEAEINMVIHSLGGVIRLRIEPTHITLVFQDVGPGIEAIELAMTPGYSTASEKARELGFGAGMGLINIKNVSDQFALESSSAGTILTVGFDL